MLWMIIFLGIPILLAICSVKVMLDYLLFKREMEKNPSAYSVEEMKKKKTKMLLLVIPSIVILSIIVGFIILLYVSIAYM